MQCRRTTLIAMTLLWICSAAAQAETVAFRTEVYPVRTMNLTTAQVLLGAPTGPEAVIAGELRLPITTEVRVPVVVFVHGDAGQVANQAAWIDDLNASGIAVFTLDSFSARGLVSGKARIEGIQGSNDVDAYARMADVYGALALLSRHPRIDPKRIVLMGASSGGRMALNGAMTRFSQLFATKGYGFAAYVALYPDCNVALADDTKVDGRPIRIHIGSNDNVTAAAPCRRYVERLRSVGADATITEYPGAFHGFDSPVGSLFRIDDAPNTSSCMYAETAGGTFVNADTGKPMQREDACVTRGFTAGRDVAGAVAVHANVRQFLQQAFAPAR